MSYAKRCEVKENWIKEGSKGREKTGFSIDRRYRDQ